MKLCLQNPLTPAQNLQNPLTSLTDFHLLIIDEAKLKNVYRKSIPAHRVVLNQLTNSSIANYYITAPAP